MEYTQWPLKAWHTHYFYLRFDVLTRIHTQRNTDSRRENLENATNVNVNIFKPKR